MQRLFSVGQKSPAIPKCDLFSGNVGIVSLCDSDCVCLQTHDLHEFLMCLGSGRVGGGGSVTRIIHTCLMLHA